MSLRRTRCCSALMMRCCLHSRQIRALRSTGAVTGQVEYQLANAVLFQREIQHGDDPDLREFARQTLPKIEDHLQRALKLAGASDGDDTSD